MSCCRSQLLCRLCGLASVIVLCAIVTTTPVRGQFVQSAVGGVMIDARGAISSSTIDTQRKLAETLRQQLAAIPNDLTQPADMRKVSLRSLDAALAASIERGVPLPDEARFLGGLTRVEYLLLSPEDNDIFLAGPAEPWRINDQGDVVGTVSGSPIVLLDDLIVALRTSTAAREVGISCSIDPTAEGRRNYDTYMAEQRKLRRQVSRDMLAGAEQALGAQQITLTGVPTDTHFACVLVAADYQMKRFAMHLEKAPLDAMPSYLDLIKQRRARVTQVTPRWWLACDYEPIARTEDGLSWHLRGQGVRVETEDHIASANGEVEHLGKSSPIAQQWADNMTNNYQTLSVAAPIFGQLRNVMDLSVFAALIEKEQLLQKVNCELQVMYDSSSDPLLLRWNAPQSVDTQTSFIKTAREFVITASGGVQVGSWQVADRTAVHTNLPTADKNRRPTNRNGWYWD